MSWVLFFDGECGLCNRTVVRIHAQDRDGKLDFAALQGRLSEKLGYAHYAEEGGGSLVLLDENSGQFYVRGEALVNLGKLLGGVWAILARMYAFLPKEGQDAMYGLIAKNRHLLGGGAQRVPIPKERMRE